MNKAITIKLSGAQRDELGRRVRSQTIDVRVARRARIVLLAADGVGNHEIARRLEISRGQVISWRNRFAQGGVSAIEDDLPRSGRKPRIDASEIVRLTTQTTPEGATHWSTRKLAAKMGVSDTTVHKVWKANGLKPHLVETFKVSRDPRFAEKLEDIVGLYVSPPEHALVLRRKKPGPGIGPHPAGTAIEERPGRYHDARLQTAWHDHFVCGNEYTRRFGDLALRATAPPYRVAGLPASD